MRKSKRSIEKIVRGVMDQSMKSLLHDIDYRIGILADMANGANRIHSTDINLPSHMLDGFVFTDNSPGAGSVAWSGCHIVYKGTDYTITDGNTTGKYICWLLSAPTVFTTGDVKPELTNDDVLVAINDNGTARIQIVPGKMTHGGAIVSGSVNSAELGNGAVIADKIAALAVIEGKIANSAITNTKIANNAVGSTKIVDGAVATAKLAANAVDGTKLKDGAVSGTKIVDGAVATVKLAANAVDGTKLKDGAVSTNKIVDGAVGSAKLGDGAVTTTKIGDSQITGPKIGAGAVAESKLNIAMHLLW